MNARIAASAARRLSLAGAVAIGILALGWWLGRSRIARWRPSVPGTSSALRVDTVAGVARLQIAIARLRPAPAGDGAPDLRAARPGEMRIAQVALVKRGDLGALATLHPWPIDSATASAALPNLPAGTYDVFVELGSAQGAYVHQDSLHLSGAMHRWKPSSPSDAAFSGGGVGTPFRFDDGVTLGWLGAAERLEARRPTMLRFRLRDANGRPVSHSPDSAHSTWASIVHAGPAATWTPLRPASEDAAQGEMAFIYPFPVSGAYRLWVGFHLRGRIRTAAFDVHVEDRR